MTEAEVEIIQIGKNENKENNGESTLSTTVTDNCSSEKSENEDKSDGEAQGMVLEKTNNLAETTNENNLNEQIHSTDANTTLNQKVKTLSSRRVSCVGSKDAKNSDDVIVELEALKEINEYVNTQCMDTNGSSEQNTVDAQLTQIPTSMSNSDESHDSHLEGARGRRSLKRKNSFKNEMGENANKVLCNGDISLPKLEANGNPKEDLRDPLSLVDCQVQCVNLHCQSGYGLAEAPVFVLTFFGAMRRKNVLQKVCAECFKKALQHQEELVFRLKNYLPLFRAEFPRQKDDVVVMDPVEEIYEEEIISEDILEKVKNCLPELMEEVMNKYDIMYQIDQSTSILSEKYCKLEASNKLINVELSAIEKSLKESRILMYKDFTPKIKTLPSLNISENIEDKKEENLKSDTCKRSSRAWSNTSIKEVQSRDIVAVEEVEVPQSKLPPVGSLTYPLLCVGDPVYVMKISFFGVWVKGKVIEIIARFPGQPPSYRIRFDVSYRIDMTKVVSGKHLAYSEPSDVRYPVGTRVIALFRNNEVPAKEAYYAGLIAEPPKHINKFRYLVFFDDGYAQYVTHEKILLVCEFSKFVHEDIHPESREFIKKYLDQYPERPMVKLQPGQIVRTELNGKWWLAHVMEIDCSLAKMQFYVGGRTEWIYRGCTRLWPLYSKLVAAAARKELKSLSRHRSLCISSLKKRNMPYVEYSVDQDDTKPQGLITGISKNVAKKSTAFRGNSQEYSTDKNPGPPKPFEKKEYVTKGYIRCIDLSSRIPGRKFTPHQCGPPCTDWTNYAEADCKGINPLARPLFFGFERQSIKAKGKRIVMYRAPCGRRLRNMVEIHRYLRITKTPMGLDFFDFDHLVHVLDEFHLEKDMYRTHLKDISYGLENNPVPCVNEIDHSWPSFMDYSTSRIPQEGVKICLDEDFLVCCDCTDDCKDKDKCECWQLTIEGTKLGPEGLADPSVGYQNKRLLEPVTTGIYECNSRCKCASTCLNRVAQLPLQINLQVFRTLKKGWGLRTLNDIPQGGFICIYAGRLHTEQSANDDGRMYGDEYLAELDYIEVVERFKEGYESEVIEPNENNEMEKDEDEKKESDREDKWQSKDDSDYVPKGLNKLPETRNAVNTRARRKKISSVDSEKEKDEGYTEDDSTVDEDDEMKKKPSKFTAALPTNEEEGRKYKSVRELFGDGADDCYIMDAKSIGNIGRYLNHSCQPNVFVQNVFVDTHDVRFPWVAFFALTHIKAGTELTWDYNYDVGSVPHKVLYCYCNSSECRGRLL